MMIMMVINVCIVKVVQSKASFEEFDAICSIIIPHIRRSLKITGKSLEHEVQKEKEKKEKAIFY